MSRRRLCCGSCGGKTKKKNPPPKLPFPLLALPFALLSLRHLDLALLCFARAGIGGVRAADRCDAWIMGCGESSVGSGASRRRTLRDGLMSRRATGPTGGCFFSQPSSAGSEKYARAPVTDLVGAGRHRWGLSI